MTDSSLAARVREIERSQIRVMYDRAEAYDGDRDLVRLEVGEPDFDTPGHVIDAAADAARAGRTHYTPNAGERSTREAVADHLAGSYGLDADPENEVVITVGGMEALHLALLAIVDPGEEVLIPTPGWPNYFLQARLAEGRAREVAMPADAGFALDADRVIEAMGVETAVVMLTSPSNPTGRVYDEDAVRAVVDAAAEYDAYVVADEVYRALTYEGSDRATATYVDHPERVLTVGSCSKEFAMTGWRLGWLIAPEPVASAVAKSREATTACPSSVAQAAARAALTGPSEPFDAMRDAFEERRDYVVDRVDAMPVVSCARPEGAFYAFLDVRAADAPSLDVATHLLEEYGVVTAPGGGFGAAGEGYLRLSFANSLERLELGLNRIEEWVEAELR